jgi:enoyl-CoA hydratase
VSVWTFDRPQARNAIDESVVNGLERALAEAEQDAALRAVVLTGSGQAAFVSGADLKFLRDAPPAQREANDARMLALMERLEQLPVPVIAALNGPVVGGGSEIAMACDLRIAEPHVTITLKHAAMGVSPGWGGLARLAGLVGRSAAAKLLFTALPIAAEEALCVGLVDELVEPGHSLARARELAEAVTRVSPSTVAELKRLLWLTYAVGPQLSRNEERRTFLARSRSADHAEALAAFFERRPANFRPRGQG